MCGKITSVEKCESYYFCNNKSCEKKKILKRYCETCETQYSDKQKIGRSLYAYVMVQSNETGECTRYTVFENVITAMFAGADGKPQFNYRGDLAKKVRKLLPLAVKFKADGEKISYLISVQSCAN